MKYDYIIITHLPSFYKVNLYNTLAQRLRLFVIFLGKTSRIRTEDFILEDFQFDAIFLSTGNFEQRNKQQTTSRLVKCLKQHSFKRLIVSGWDQIEYWIALFFSKKENNCLSLESGFESQRRGAKKLLKQIFLSRINQVYATGNPQIDLLKHLHYKGSIFRTGGVGLFYTNQSKTIARFKGKFLYVGRLAQEKNLPILIEAFKVLPEFSLSIVGHGPYQVPKLANIQLLGHVPQAQMGKLYTQYDVLLLPSLQEPWGLVVEEALAYGLPVVASERVGAKEIIEKYQCGLLFDPNNVDALIECIKFIAQPNVYSVYQANTQSNWKQIRDTEQINAYIEGLYATSFACSSSDKILPVVMQPQKKPNTLPIRLSRQLKTSQAIGAQPSKLRILLIHNYYKSNYKGGEDIVFERELYALKNVLGEENVIVYTAHNNEVKLWKLPFTIWFNVTHYKNVLTLCYTHKIQLVHIHNFFPALTLSVFLAAKRAGCKVIHTLHNYRFWCLNGTLFYKGAICEACTTKPLAILGVQRGCYRNSKMQSFLTALSFAFYKIFLPKVIDGYFALSQHQKHKLDSLIGKRNKIFLKYNAIPAAKPTFMAKSGYLFVGRLEEGKGILTLLEIWNRLEPNYSLKIIGSGPLEQDLKRAYQKENILFLGTLLPTAVQQHMAQAKYLIQPSLYYETFGLTVLEAMSHGTPVIGFNIGTRPEFIEHNKNGFIVEPQALKERLIEFENFPKYYKLCENAWKTSQQFEARKVITDQIALYERILGDVC